MEDLHNVKAYELEISKNGTQLNSVRVEDLKSVKAYGSLREIISLLFPRYFW